MDERILKLSPDQYRELLWALETARHLHVTLEGTGHSVGERKSERIEEALQAVLSQAAMFDADELVERENGIPYVAGEMEGDIHDALERYDDLAFMDILSEELAEKEFRATYSQAEAKKMSSDEYGAKLDALVQKYDKLLQKGLDGLLNTAS